MLHQPSICRDTNFLTLSRQPKKAKEAGAVKTASTGDTTRGSKRGRGGGGRGQNAGRRKPKTADELDAEMVDYFDPSAVNGTDGANNANGGQPVVNGGAGVEMDEISVRDISDYCTIMC